jgi:hypothetical protein
MTQSELNDIIEDFSAEKQYAQNMAEEAKSDQEAEVWEIIETAFTNLIWKLKNYKLP